MNRPRTFCVLAILSGTTLLVLAGTAEATADPTPFTATGGESSVTLNWGTVSGATYEIYWGTSSGGENTILAFPGAGTTSYTHGSLTNGVTYFYKIRALGSDSTYSNFVFDNAVAGARPGAPGTPSVTGTTTSSISISWTLGSSGSGALTDQYVFWHTPDGADHQSLGVSGTATSYTMTGLPASTTVTQIHVYARNAYGIGPDSGSISATTSASPTAPGAPSQPTGSSITRTSMVVSWSPGGDGGSAITSYTLYYSTTFGSGYSSVSQSGTSRGFTGLASNTQYYYHVTATNAIGTSSQSTEGDIQTTSCDAPGAPTGLIVTSTTTTSASLSWTAPADNGGSPITAYYIRKGTSSGNYPTTTVTSDAATTYTMTGLTTGSTYYFAVAALSGGCATPLGPNSGEVSAAAVNSDTTPPGPITSVVLTPGFDSATSNTYIHATYVLPTDPDFDHISVSYKGTSDAAFGTSGNPLQGPYAGTNFYLDNLASATTYYVRVRVYDTLGNYREQGPFSATTSDTSAPAAPSGFSGSTGTTYVSLSWNANTESDLARYLLYRGEGTSGFGFSLLSNMSSSTLAYNDTTVLGGRTYHYLLRAQDTSANLGPSTATLDYTVPTDTTAPPAVLAFTATGSDHVVHLRWTPSDAADLDHYLIARGTSPVFVLAQLASPGSNNATFDDYAVENGTTYGYRIAAVDHTGNVGNYTDPMSTATPGANALVQSAAEAQVDNIWGLALLVLGVSVIVGILVTLKDKVAR